MQNRIQERIKQVGVMQKDLAKKLGMSPVALTQILSVKTPRIDTLEKIAAALGVPVWSLILSDEEINQIHEMKVKDLPSESSKCPKCGTMLKISSFDAE